jgi:hypothetical protein
MEVKAKQNIEKHMSMTMENHEKIAEAKTQSGSIQVKEWTQQKEGLEAKALQTKLGDGGF